MTPASTTQKSMSTDQGSDNVALVRSVEEHMAAVDNAQTANPTKDLCPYHQALVRRDYDLLKNMSTMERYFIDSVSEQYALYRRPDTGNLSTLRPCTCGNPGQN